MVNRFAKMFDENNDKYSKCWPIPPSCFVQIRFQSIFFKRFVFLDINCHLARMVVPDFHLFLPFLTSSNYETQPGQGIL